MTEETTIFQILENKPLDLHLRLKWLWLHLHIHPFLGNRNIFRVKSNLWWPFHSSFSPETCRETFNLLHMESYCRRRQSLAHWCTISSLRSLEWSSGNVDRTLLHSWFLKSAGEAIGNISVCTDILRCVLSWLIIPRRHAVPIVGDARGPWEGYWVQYTQYELYGTPWIFN